MIVQTITDPYHFWNWIRTSDSYKDNFSMQGAWAVQDYFDENSYELDDTHSVEFDPIAWCVEFSEFSSALEAYNQYYAQNDDAVVADDELEARALEWLQDQTTVIELDGGGVIVGEF